MQRLIATILSAHCINRSPRRLHSYFRSEWGSGNPRTNATGHFAAFTVSVG